MTYEEAKQLQDNAGKYINRELQWSNGKELIRCKFVGLSGDKIPAEKKDKNYKLFAVLETEKKKRFTESVKSIVTYFEEH